MSDALRDDTHVRSRSKQARLTLNITARELSRDTATLLDEIEDQQREFTVIRHGRPVAKLGPLRETGSEEVTDLPELPELQDKVMQLFELENPRVDFYGLLDATRGQIALAVAKLEIAGLISRTWSGSYALTQRGVDYLRVGGVEG